MKFVYTSLLALSCILVVIPAYSITDAEYEYYQNLSSKETIAYKFDEVLIALNHDVAVGSDDYMSLIYVGISSIETAAKHGELSGLEKVVWYRRLLHTHQNAIQKIDKNIPLADMIKMKVVEKVLVTKITVLLKEYKQSV